jgi:CheY-like chemotaxis protein
VHGISGIEAARQIQKVSPKSPIIFLSAFHSRDAIQAQGTNSGVSVYREVPIDVQSSFRNNSLK